MAASRRAGARETAWRLRPPRPPASFSGRLSRSKDGRWAEYPAATQAACARRLLPTGLLRTLDFMLRQDLVRNPGGAMLAPTATSTVFLLNTLLIPTLRARLESCRAGLPLPLRHKAQRRDTATGAAVAAGGEGGGGGPLWHPQDELGLVVTWAKLARRETAAARALLASGAPVPPSDRPLTTLGMLCSVLPCVVAGRQRPYFLPGLDSIVAELPLPPPPPAPPAAPADPADPQQQQQLQQPLPAAPPQSPAAQSVERVRVAVLEAVMLCNHVLLQLLEVYCDSFAAFVTAPNWPGGSDRLAVLLLPLPPTMAAAISCTPPAELLAAGPQRVLAAVGRLLAAATGAGRNAARSTSATSQAWSKALQELAAYVPSCIALMASDPQLVGAVAGWLTGRSALLDVDALVGAVGVCDRSAAAAVTAMRDAAASGDLKQLAAAARPYVPPRSAREGGAAVRAAAAAGGLGGAPLWPPRVLRLCGNPGCRNLGCGDVEADLKLQQCSGCRVLRYCCAECQKEHWRQGHKAECAAVAAGRSAGVPAASAMPAPAVASDVAGGSAAAGPGTGGAEPAAGPWSLEELMAMRPRELKAILAERGVDCSDCVEKADLARRVLERC
ncbi:hypothetical protein TSOC_004579 [Tetrabaena socialis]|uniref:MYND-type domain-containing protein n=1 Tax=Tetrabaena socialis TaxID=47790 RepID=A0A2J8A8I8_9CHLO|nr:hypothetical protein TSOC_004579 [Tetrabaena socialis]|eukprot:PNH08844.1 hypothetical protein TSOC_004579 [Tetrabaena socialis]